MVTYIIASKANQPYLAECQMLGEFIETNCPDVSVKVVIKHQTEWSDFLDSVCRSYGFYSRTCPLVYTIEGTLIGDGAAFVEHVRDRYEKVLGMTKETQKKRTTENMNLIQEEMRKKKDGLTLAEKIEKHLEKIKSKDAVSLIDDSFFEKETEGGLLWYLRRTNLIKNQGRETNVVDEVEQQRIANQIFEEAEEKRDRTFDEFKDHFEDYILGKAANERVAHESNFGDEVKSNRSKSAKGKSKTMTGVRSEPDDDEGDDAKSSKSRKSGVSDKDLQDEINKKFDEEKQTIPESCYLSFSKSAKIEKMDAKFLLVAHPLPMFEGEMLIIQPKKEDQPESDFIVYRDYSLRKRIATRPKPQLSATEQLRQKKNKKENEIAKLQCLEVNLDEPLCNAEWVNLALLINETQGLGWFQILPVDQKSSMPYQFNSIHILPQSKIPVAKLPIDLYITQAISYARKMERSDQNGKTEVQRGQTAEEENRNQLEQFARTQGLMMLPQFKFEHAIYMLTESQLSYEGLNYGYQKIVHFLQLRSRQNLGLTVVVTPKWIFVTLLSNPYVKTSNEIPVYLDGYAFCGLVNLQTVEPVWPATAANKNEQLSVLESIAKSTKSDKMMSKLNSSK